MLVLGAGAIGGWLGALLHQAGHAVELVGRRPLQQAVAAQGLRVEGLTDAAVRLRVHVEPPPGTFDVVLLTAKAHQTLAMAPVAARCAGAHGIVVSVQNGLGNVAKLAAHVGRERVCAALTSNGLHVPEPGRIVHAGRGPTVIGAPPGGDAAGRRALALLADAGLSPVWTDDLEGAVWTKAAVNAAVNPLGALYGIANGQILDAHAEEAEELAREVYALSRAAGVRLHADPVEATRATLAATRANRCSMLQDVAAHRLTEVEQITGAFVRIARRLGHPLFANEDVYGRVKALEASYLGEEAALAATRAEAEWGIPLGDGSPDGQGFN